MSGAEGTPSTPDMLTRSFTAETRLDAIQAAGHLRRSGHELRGYYIAERPTDPQDAPLWTLVRECCGPDARPLPTKADVEIAAAHVFTQGRGCRCGLISIDSTAADHKAHLARIAPAPAPQPKPAPHPGLPPMPDMTPKPEPISIEATRDGGTLTFSFEDVLYIVPLVGDDDTLYEDAVIVLNHSLCNVTGELHAIYRGRHSTWCVDCERAEAIADGYKP